VLIRADRVLLCHRHPARRWFPDVWDLPGGHVEADETERAALVRELREEVGVDVAEADLDEVVRVPLPDYGDRPGGLMTVFHVRQWRHEPTNCCPHEHDDLGWFDLDELAGLAVPDPAYRTLLHRLLE
jgi:8-oxo-dGTP pyrophosphatase MutT (NUDIX family)